MAKPRLYLFHGNDTRTSSLELQRWLEVFTAKYGETTQYMLHADELSHDELLQKLRQVLETQSLFPEPKFIVLKRLTTSATPAKVKEVLAIVGGQLSGFNELVTLVFWEDRLVGSAHPLNVWFEEHVAKKQAEVKVSRVPQGNALVASVIKRSGSILDDQAIRWLEQYAKTLEREQRIEGKLRATEDIASDRRVWTLQSLVESASLIAAAGTVRREQLEKVAGVVAEAVSPFEIINAVQSHNWQRAQLLTRQWEKEDEAAYFGLVALLRNHFRREGSRQSGYALELLAEIEILSKNVSLRQAWLLDVFFERCRVFQGEHVPLMSAKRLWLSHVQRVE